MTTQHDPGPTLDTEGVSQYTGISVSTLRQQRVKGGPDSIPYIKIGRSVRYLRSDLDAYMAARRVTSTIEARAKARQEPMQFPGQLVEISPEMMAQRPPKTAKRGAGR
ncbi:helix-turn-helix domain-containing protein [Azospirillum sp. B510]|uniref:helix-turn-helix domain-containing protein n=1 Tax=Azospirillum sp. (strain B510) TaxID=137722 RepID=UPI0005AA785C|nr:helix-turn-helix domain-containing protein [Azospirillum sp. B510]